MDIANQNDKQPVNVAPWLISIAISVMCCSVLFVFFASYIAGIKESVAMNALRLSNVEARQDKTFLEMSYLRKPAPLVVNDAKPATDAVPTATTPDAPVPPPTGQISPTDVPLPNVAPPSFVPPSVAPPVVTPPTLNAPASPAAK